MVEPEDGQEFGVVIKMLGNGRLNVLCSDNIQRIAKIRGSMRKGTGKTIVEKGDLVLISRRDFEEDKVDIIHKYNHEEASILIRADVPEALIRAWHMRDGSMDLDENISNVVFAEEDDPVFETI